MALWRPRPSSTSIGKLDQSISPSLLDIGFTHAYPMMKKSEAGDRLEKLLRTLQTFPEAIVTDGAGKEIGGDCKRTID
jgi:hypothetical protein